jgi:hypothetical protein
VAEDLDMVWWFHIHVSNDSLDSGPLEQGQMKKYPLSAMVTICLNILNNFHLHRQKTKSFKWVGEIQSKARLLVLSGPNRGL